MANPCQIVIASHNAGKIREINHFFSDLSIHVLSQEALPVSEVHETGLTFVENALMKAHHAAQKTNLPVLADDSGLVVHALSGQPGIHSARYAGPRATDQENVEKLLKELGQTKNKDRTAYYYCVIVLLAHAKDPTPLICEAKWFGEIATSPKGNQGFGYDPIFYLPDLKKTAAELELSQKNRLSHRGSALQLLKNSLSEKLCLLSSSKN